MKNFLISKTLYVNSSKCHKKAWLNKYKKHLREPISLAGQLNIEEGHAVGKLAIRHIDGKGLMIDTKDKEVAIEQTRKAIKNKVAHIFEASFRYKNQFVQVDILKNNFDGTFDIIEVKSANNIKDHHYTDVGFQKYVVERNGLTINTVSLMHLNKEYSLTNTLDLNGLFVMEDLTDEANIEFLLVEENVKALNLVLSNKVEPKADCGSQCSNPHKCEFYNYCHKEINKDSIENLSRLSTKKKSELQELKIKYIKDIPENFTLTDRQSIQRTCAITNEFHVQAESINNFLDSIKYPAYYLDFEATNRAIPSFEGMRPNQFLVYQASIHKQENKNAKLKHTEYLHLKKADPRIELIQYLIKDLGTKGSIIVWNKSFESTRLKELGEQLPQYKEVLDGFIARFFDLADVFSKTYCYHHNMEGSSSIKNVLSVIDPHFSYDRLVIKNGTDSQAHYIKMLSGKYKGGMYQKMKKALLEYNKLDTLAMFVIKQSLETSKFLANTDISC
jgi:hypothetical protein